MRIAIYADTVTTGKQDFKTGPNGRPKDLSTTFHLPSTKTQEPTSN
ncbi:MAG TPA: hypothetical protein VIG25_19460 [Pyrinomonadaceae bacterium]